LETQRNRQLAGLGGREFGSSPLVTGIIPTNWRGILGMETTTTQFPRPTRKDYWNEHFGTAWILYNP